ncbi:MAG: ComEC/Rec2 family competence protein [Christensenellales bacterium]|jgi:competence protein ComEC
MNKRRFRSAKALLALGLALSLLLCACEILEVPGVGDPLSSPADAGEFSVHVIDVGQGDAILVRCGDQDMLVDAGPQSGVDQLLAYLEEVGVARLTAVVETHPHEDHIGGMDEVLAAYPVDKVYLSPASSTTKSFERVLDAIDEQGLDAEVPEAGDRFSLGAAQVEVLGPAAAYDDANDSSLVLKVTYQGQRVLLQGDAEARSERDILASGADVAAEVIKLGHHGSNTSTDLDYLEAVDPDLALISCGQDNSYGHPHEETLDKLIRRQITFARTDLEGTLVVAYQQGRLALLPAA